MTSVKPAAETTPDGQPTAAAELTKKRGWWADDASEPVRRNLGLVGVLVAIWIVGVVTYHACQRLAPQFGAALPALAVSFVLAWATRGMDER